MQGSPSLGVVDVIVAIGPFPSLVIALMLKMYKVDGLSSDTVMDVVFTSGTGISRIESGPTICTVYPVTTELSSPSGKGFQEISAVVGSPCLMLSPV